MANKFQLGNVILPTDVSAFHGSENDEYDNSLFLKNESVQMHIYDKRLAIPGVTDGELFQRNCMIWEANFAYQWSTRHSSLNYNVTLDIVLPHIDWYEGYEKDRKNYVQDRLRPYLLALGQMPRCMLHRLKSVNFLGGNEPWSTGSNYLTIHTDTNIGAEKWWHGIPAWWNSDSEYSQRSYDLNLFNLRNEFLEEVMLHYTAISALDYTLSEKSNKFTNGANATSNSNFAMFYNITMWQRAKELDCKRFMTEDEEDDYRKIIDKESRSETWLLYFAYRFRRDRLTKDLIKYLHDTMPARIQYFDSLHFESCCDMTAPSNRREFCEKVDWRHHTGGRVDLVKDDHCLTGVLQEKLIRDKNVYECDRMNTDVGFWEWMGR